ncbi:hypothetical protein BJX61DRAFT_9983 [Aspergillus egyptiacus]|nr:hypothetical protein BJX61DRAFT_9983 [Aspergillus egyptiacus]
MDPPRNRKQRRAAAAAQSDSFDPSSIPLARPPQNDSSKAKGKTLMDIISEKQNELGKGTSALGSIKSMETRYVTVDPTTGELSPVDGVELPSSVKNGVSAPKGGELSEEQTENDAPIPPLIDTILLSIPLTVLHFTLGYLAAHQYAQSIQLDVLSRNSCLVAFPILTLLIHLAHGHIISFNRGRTESQFVSLFPWDSSKLSFSFLRRLLFPPSLKTMVFLPGAVFLGCKLIAMTNEDAYYAVLKNAPAIGTLWVWCVLEIPVGAAVLGALGPLIWGVWWKGYSIV